MKGEGEKLKVDEGREEIMSGGWLGKGKGEGKVKRIIKERKKELILYVEEEE